VELYEDDIVVNPTLQAKLLNDYGIALPESLKELSLSELEKFLGGYTVSD